jgi:hypothetical protein
MLVTIEEWEVFDDGVVGGFMNIDWAAQITPTDNGWEVLVGFGELDYPQRRSLHENLGVFATLGEAKKAVDAYYLEIQGANRDLAEVKEVVAKLGGLKRLKAAIAQFEEAKPFWNVYELGLEQA